MIKLNSYQLRTAELRGLERLVCWLGLTLPSKTLPAKEYRHTLISLVQREEKRIQRLPRDKRHMKKT